MTTRNRFLCGAAVLVLLAGATAWLRVGNRELQEERERRVARIAELHHDQPSATAVDAPAKEAVVPTRPQVEKELARTLATIRAAQGARPPRPFSSSSVVLSELMAEPEYAIAVHQFYRSQLESRYAPWVQTVPAEQQEKLMALLVSELLVANETENVARQAGLAPDASPRDLARLQEQIRERIVAEKRELLGEQGYQAFQNFIGSIMAMEALAKITLRLSYSDEPLTREQQEAVLVHMDEGRKRFFNILRKDAIYAAAEAVFTPGQWAEVQRYGREIGALPAK